LSPSSAKVTTEEVTEGGKHLDEAHGIALIMAGQQHGHLLEFLNVRWCEDAHCVIPYVSASCRGVKEG